MTKLEELKQGLSRAGLNEKTQSAICSLYESGHDTEMLRQMKLQRCELVELMHESQRKVDLIDYLIRMQEKRMVREGSCDRR